MRQSDAQVGALVDTAEHLGRARDEVEPPIAIEVGGRDGMDLPHQLHAGRVVDEQPATQTEEHAHPATEARIIRHDDVADPVVVDIPEGQPLEGRLTGASGRVPAEQERGLERTGAQPEVDHRIGIAPAGHDDVDQAVALDVEDLERVRPRRGRQARRRAEGPVAETREHREVGTQAVGDDQVEQPVAVDVSGRERSGTGGRRGVVDRRREQSAALAQQHGQRAGRARPARQREVEVLVPVEVGNHDGDRGGPDRHGHRSREAARAIPDVDRGLAARRLDGHHVRDAVGADVRDGQRARGRAGEGPGVFEAAIPASEQQLEARARCDDRVHPAVAVDVSQLDRRGVGPEGELGGREQRRSRLGLECARWLAEQQDRGQQGRKGERT